MFIRAALSTFIPSGNEGPGEIVYLPEGVHKITPFVNGKPKQVTVKLDAKRGPAIAARLQQDLEKRLKQNVRPWIDFNHEGRASAGNPVSVRYVEGKGIVMALEWSDGGIAAVQGKDFRYFSPSFNLAPNGEPGGLPERGPVGGLVNEPAFRDIPAVAAKNGDPEPLMNEEALKILGIDPNRDDAEEVALRQLKVMAADQRGETVDAAASGVRDEIRKLRKEGMSMNDIAKKLDIPTDELSDILEGRSDKMPEGLKKKLEAINSINSTNAMTADQKLEAENADLKQRLAALEADRKAERKTRANQLVTAAQADGRIAPRDEKTATKFREKIEAGDAFAEDILEQLPKRHDGMDKPLVTGGQSKDRGNAEQRIDAALGKAREQCSAGADFPTIWAQAREIDPQAFADELVEA